MTIPAEARTTGAAPWPGTGAGGSAPAATTFAHHAANRGPGGAPRLPHTFQKQNTPQRIASPSGTQSGIPKKASQSRKM